MVDKNPIKCPNSAQPVECPVCAKFNEVSGLRHAKVSRNFARAISHARFRSAVKSYGKAAAKQAGRNLYKGAVIPAIDEGIREAGSAMYGGKEGGDGPPSPPPNPLLGVQQAYASYATTANALNPYTS